MAVLEQPTLRGRTVELVPLARDHVEALVAAAREDRASYGFTTVPADVDSMAVYVGELLAASAAGDSMPYVQVRRQDQIPVGCTRFLRFRQWPDGRPFAVEVGGTWLAASAQRTTINAEAKLLLFGHAFETWELARVDLQTDARNAMSRRAIEGVGAVYEGVLRRWGPSHVAGEEGRLRDSAIYSITNEDWPQIRRRLTQRMSQSEQTPPGTR